MSKWKITVLRLQNIRTRRWRNRSTPKLTMDVTKSSIKKPHIVSALGAIPKKNSPDVRLIHDASRPSGSALNDYAINNPFSYQSIQDAVNLVTSGCYFAKLDLSNDCF